MDYQVPPLDEFLFYEGSNYGGLIQSEIFKLIYKGFEPQTKKPDPVCRTCNAPVKAVFTKSKIFGAFGLIPAECDKCKEEAYQQHIQMEAREKYLAGTTKCCGYQNKKVAHNSKLVSLSDITYEAPWQAAVIDYMMRVCEGEEKRGLFLAGTTGIGKTFLAKILNNELHDQSRPVCFLKAVDLAMALRKETFGDNYKEVIKDFRNVETLIVDDFGTQKNTEFVKESIFSILDYRYENRKRTIITTNLSLDDLEQDDRRLSSRFRDKGWLASYKIVGADLRPII